MAKLNLQMSFSLLIKGQLTALLDMRLNLHHDIFLLKNGYQFDVVSDVR